MTKEHLIHLKLEHGEAIQLKRDILSTEMGLLKIAKIIRHYGHFRLEELELKLELHKKIRGVKTDLGNLQKILPKLNVPERFRKDRETETPTESRIKKEIYRDDGLETQLQEIQNRLNELQREGI